MSFANNYFRNMNYQYRNARHDRSNQTRNYREQSLINVNEMSNNINHILNDVIYNYNDNYNDNYTDTYNNNYDSIVDRDRIERYFYRLIYELNRDLNEQPIAKKFNINTHKAEEINTHVEMECNICYELNEKTKFIKLNCNHEFCKECVKNILKTCRSDFKEPCCAYCRTIITDFTYKNEKIQEEFSDLIV
jgi:hypothetical protein